VLPAQRRWRDRQDVFHAGNARWMFTCPNPMAHDTLCLFRAESLSGPWTEHPPSPIIAGDSRIARPAGRVIPWDNGLLRFGQDCSRGYGLQVRAFHISSLTSTVYRETPILDGPVLAGGVDVWNARGMHHIDVHSTENGVWLAAVDGWN
jgi:hypothetical protein